MSDQDPRIDRAIELLRTPAGIGEAFDRRVMDAVRQLPPPARPGPVRRAATWIVEPHQLRIRPITLVAAAAVVLAVAGVVRRTPAPPATPGEAPPSSVQFVLVAPGAASVSLVGDFNDWGAAATPMSVVNGGLWTVVVPLDPGRYRYAFLVDGTTWVPDPTAPRSLDDDFGRPNSVLTIGGT